MAIIQPSTVTANVYTIDSITDDGDALESTPEDYDPSREAYEWSVTAGDSTPVLNTRGARLVIAVAEGTAKWEVPNIDNTRVRQHAIAGLSANPTATVIGVITAGVMPDQVQLTDTSTATNEVTIYIYK